MIGITWPVPTEIDDAELERRLFTPAGFYKAPTRATPDWNHVHAELRRRGVTLLLLWEEYRTDQPDGYGYRRFCGLYIEWRRGVSATMRQKGIMAAIEGGAYNEILRARLTELETRRTQIDAELATAIVPPPVTLHPNAAGLYAARVRDLEAALNEPDLVMEATRTIRSLVQQIVLTPDEESANGLALWMCTATWR